MSGNNTSASSSSIDIGVGVHSTPERGSTSSLNLNGESKGRKTLIDIDTVSESHSLGKEKQYAKKFEARAKRDKLEISDGDVNFILEKVNNRTFEQAKEVINRALKYHKDDANFNMPTYEKLERLAQGPGEMDPEEYEFEVLLEAAFIDDWSPYPEVRAVTQIGDDPTELCETFRVYVIGLVYAVAGCILNTFFFNRFPSITLPSLCLQLLVAPSGRLWADFMPSLTVRGFALNPGPWTYKEQMLTTLMISVSAGAPYSLYVITAQKSVRFYNFGWITFGYEVLLTLTSNFMGFGIAGFMRTFLVYPVKAMWFAVLPTLSLNRTLVHREATVSSGSSLAAKFAHFWKSKEEINGWRMTRLSFFWLFCIISFAWYWVPEFLFTCLSYFNWMTWISPHNVNLAAITGSITGLAVNPISTLDWSIISGFGMVTPYWATNNQMFGQLIAMFAIVILWYTNARWTGHIPINSNQLYSNEGTPYNVSRVLNNDNLLDDTQYKDYSPPYYTAGNLVVYGSFFMLYPAMIVYSILHYRNALMESCRQFWFALRNPSKALHQFDDPFTRAIRVHKEVPEWWFLLVLVISLALSIVLVEHFPHTNTPVWTLFFAVGINCFFIIPFGLLFAITNTSWDVNVLVELIIGYALPGNPNALMIVKCYATNFLSQTENYVTNQKQGLYARVPPRGLFRVQMLSVFVCSIAAVALLNWQLDGAIHDYCDLHQHQKFTCANSRTFFSASVLWGTIGPKRVFNHLYPAMKYCFLIGVFLPIPFYLIGRMRRFEKYASRINVLIMIAGCIDWAPYNWMYHLPDWYLGIAFNWYIKRNYTAWWQKYNYLLYAALSAGVSWSAFIMFFSTEYKHLAEIKWWGNEVQFRGLDAEGPVRLPIPSKGYFGLQKGEYY